MRTREEVDAQRPLLWDIIAFANEKFTRHQSHDSLPAKALYPTGAYDLMKCGFSTRGARGLTTRWKRIRSMEVTHPAEPVPPHPIPRDSDIFAPGPIRRRGAVRKPSSTSTGKGRWPGALRGVQTIQLVYQPGRVQSHDITLATLPPRAQDIIQILCRQRVNRWTRIALYELLAAEPLLETYHPTTPWSCWTRYEARIRAAGLIREWDYRGKEVT